MRTTVTAIAPWGSVLAEDFVLFSEYATGRVEKREAFLLFCCAAHVRHPDAQGGLRRANCSAGHGPAHGGPQAYGFSQ